MGWEGGGDSSKDAGEVGKRTAEGLERVEVHWPGKGGKLSIGKIWNCVLFTPSSDTEVEEEDENVTTGERRVRPRRAAGATACRARTPED